MQSQQIAAIWPALVLGLLAGCAGTADRYTPTPALARESLSNALTAWRDENPVRSIAGGPVIECVDTSRQPDQNLRAFEILSEQSFGAQGRLFVVRLTFDKPAVERRARYVVVGIDPIWVFEKDDYDRLAHWEHPMEPSEPAATEETNPNSPASDNSPTSPGSARYPAITHDRA